MCVSERERGGKKEKVCVFQKFIRSSTTEKGGTISLNLLKNFAVININVKRHQQDNILNTDCTKPR